MLKVLFYHANDTLRESSKKLLFLGVASLYLKTWIDQNRPEIGEQINWMIPIQKKMSDDELVSLLEREKPDLFCSSHYIWNDSFICDQLTRIKSRVPSNICFIAGGPSIDVNIDPDFFAKKTFPDYAIYGAGEVAFADIVESILKNKKLIAFNTSNVAWFDKEKNKTVVADFKYVPQLSKSPYISNKELFASIIKDVQSKNISVVLPYDLTRGCPYSCTFCDWNSGLTNKTTRRKNSYKDEIDLFQELKVKNIYLSDANVGQYQEDIDMIEYMGNKNIFENAGFKIDGNFSKLRKENNLKIYHILAKSNMLTDVAGFTISVQDINKTILENIDRPDVGWDVHLSMIRELKEAYPHLHSKIQLIQGLPGQTVDTWRETLREISRHDLQLQIFISELLPASPAARDKSYQEKFKFTYATSERFNGHHYFNATFPESCASFSKKDFVRMTVLSHIYSALTQFRSQKIATFNLEQVVDDFLESPMCKTVEDNLYDNWTKHNKFYYTKGVDGNSLPGVDAITACYIFLTGSIWAGNYKLLTLIAKNLDPGVMTPTEFIKTNLVKDGNRLNVKIETLAGFE
jgi:putative methyltransferase